MLHLHLERAKGTSTTVTLGGELAAATTPEAVHQLRALLRQLAQLQPLSIAMCVDEHSLAWCDEWCAVLVDLGGSDVEVSFEIKPLGVRP